MKTFEELECWKTGREIRKDVSTLIKTFPDDEKRRLVDQMLRCSRSVTNNIAEGFGKHHAKDNARYCRNSRGSLNELVDHFIIACDEGYIPESVLHKKREEISNCLRILNGYIKYLTNMPSKN